MIPDFSTWQFIHFAKGTNSLVRITDHATKLRHCVGYVEGIKGILVSVRIPFSNRVEHITCRFDQLAKA